MANATIKITNLPNIGNSLSTTSIFPVVANVNQTDKVTLGNVGNLILTEAGNTLEPAFLSTLAYSVTNAAQPNITSVGTLTSVSVSGNANIGNIGTGGLITATGNIRGANLVTPGVLSVTGNANIGNVGVSGLLTASTLSTTGNANLSALNISNVSNLKISGGADGYVLQTDGTGNLTWTAQTGGSGNGEVGGANTQVQFNDAGNFGGNSGFTFNKTTGVFTSPFLAGNGNGLSNIQGANVSGAVSFATTANAVAGANVSGTVANATTAGRIANGTSNVNIPAINGNVVVTVNGSNSWTFSTTGELALPDGSLIGEGGLYGNAAGVLGNLTGDVQVYAQNTSVGVQTYDGANYFTWDFGNTGNLTIPSGGYINFVNTGGITQAVNEDLRFTVSDDEEDGWAIQSTVNDGAGNNLTQMQVRYDGVRINTDLPTNNYSFDFRDTGEFDVPKSIRGPVGGNLVISIGDQSGSNTFIDLQTRSYVGDALISNIRIANPNVTVSTASGAYNWTFGDTGNLTLPGNTFAVNYANGSQVPLGTISSLVNGGNSFVLDSDGSVIFEGTDPGEGVDRGLVWDYGANANGVNSMIRQDLNGLTVRAYTENGGGANGYSAPVNIVTNQDATAKTWRFDGQGNLTVPSGSINSIDSVGDLGAYITLNPDLGLASLAGRNALSNVGYTNTAWSTATYTGTQIDFTNAPDLVTFFNDNQFNVGVNQTFSINGDEPVPFTGYSTGSSNAVTVYTSVTASPDPTTVTSIDFYYQLESYVGVDYDAGTLNINATGLTINLDNDQTQGPDINLRSGDDITLQGKDKSLGSESEGGDININGGDGASDDGLGNNSASGGDIIIVGGIGGSGNTGSGSSGGFARFQGGVGGDAGVGTVAGSGGYVQINAGDGGYNGGNAQLGSQGGYVEIYAGQTTIANGVGGYVTISSGTASDGNGIAGNVQITTPVSDTANGGNWIFDGRGNLTLPDGNPHIKTSDENSTVTIRVSGTANNQSQFEIGSDGGTDQYTYISSQNDTNGFASFGLNAPNGVPTSAVIGINNGTALDWTFSSAALDDTEAYLYTPAGATITTPNAPSGQTGKNIFIEAGSVDQENYNTNTGGELMLKGGRGGFNDGGGGGPGGNVNINAGESADPAGHAGNVNITAGAVTNWTFDYTGNLTLPANTFSVNYANGDPVTFGAAALGNVTFDNVTVQGVNGLNLSAGSDFTANLAYLQVRAGDVASHIHLDTGNNEAYDQYFGNDSKFVKLGLGIAGNVSIGTYQDGGVGQFEWIFDSNGNLVLAGGNSVIQSIANSSLDPLNPNVSTMVLTPDPDYSSQALVLDPTAPGHIHLRAPSLSGNIDIPAANIFLGGEDTSFEVTVGSNNYAMIHSGGNTWTFGNDGALSFPRDATGNTDPYLVISGGTTPAISSVDVSLAGPSNLQISSDYLNLSGYTGNTVSIYADDGEIFGSNDLILTSNNSGTTNSWTFGASGNLTLPGNTFAVNYANGAQVSLGSYSDSNVATFLASYGSNTISTTGNISVGAVTATGKIGYSTGGTVTQSSSGAGVTLNQLTGEITLAKSSWNAGDLEVFILQCNKVSANDYVLAQTIDSVYAPSFNVSAYYYSLLANSIYVQVKALETVTSTPKVKFFIMKAATS